MTQIDYDFDYESNGNTAKIVSNNWRTTQWIRDNFQEGIGNAIITGANYTTIVGQSAGIKMFARQMLAAEFTCEADEMIYRPTMQEKLEHDENRRARARLALEDIRGIELDFVFGPNPDFMDVKFVQHESVEGHFLTGAAFFDFRKECVQAFEKRGFEVYGDNQGHVPHEVTLRDKIPLGCKHNQLIGYGDKGCELVWDDEKKELVQLKIQEKPKIPTGWTDPRLMSAYCMVLEVIEEHAMDNDPMPDLERVKNQIRNADINLAHIIRGRVS